MTIAVDFDGTVVTHEYPRTGRDIGAVPVLKKMSDDGHKIVLNTMRSGQELMNVMNWFYDNNIPLYGVNHTPGQEKWTRSPKVYAHLYIDDCALGCPVLTDENGKKYVDWRKVSEIMGYDYDELINKIKNTL